MTKFEKNQYNPDIVKKLTSSDGSVIISPAEGVGETVDIKAVGEGGSDFDRLLRGTYSDYEAVIILKGDTTSLYYVYITKYDTINDQTLITHVCPGTLQAESGDTLYTSYDHDVLLEGETIGVTTEAGLVVGNPINRTLILKSVKRVNDGVESVNIANAGIDIDNTDGVNPKVGVNVSPDAGNALSLTGDGLFVSSGETSGVQTIDITDPDPRVIVSNTGDGSNPRYVIDTTGITGGGGGSDFDKLISLEYLSETQVSAKLKGDTSNSYYIYLENNGQVVAAGTSIFYSGNLNYTMYTLNLTTSQTGRVVISSENMIVGDIVYYNNVVKSLANRYTDPKITPNIANCVFTATTVIVTLDKNWDSTKWDIALKNMNTGNNEDGSWDTGSTNTKTFTGTVITPFVVAITNK
jgi:hypothetical protein